LKNIELEEATEFVNKSVVYLKPRIHVSEVGTYSIWMPNKR
jgi:hypothetical protein